MYTVGKEQGKKQEKKTIQALQTTIFSDEEESRT